MIVDIKQVLKYSSAKDFIECNDITLGIVIKSILKKLSNVEIIESIVETWKDKYIVIRDDDDVVIIVKL